MNKRLWLEQLEDRRLLVSDWQNPTNPFDVNDDGFVSPIDVLIGVNRLNRSAGELGQYLSGAPYYDTTGDGLHSPADVLWVVNEINNPTPGLAVGLIEDTGRGPGSDTDRLTSNFGIKGAFSRGTVDELWARWDAGAWHDVSLFLRGSSFEISDDYLIEFLDIDYTDGEHRIDIEGRIESKPNTVRRYVEFLSDQSRPRSDSPGSITMIEPRVILIPISEAIFPESPNAQTISVYDTTGISVEVQPIQIQFVGDSTLRIDLPIDTVGGSYRVNIGEEAFEDRAGNKSQWQTVYANYFDESNLKQLEFGQTVDIAAIDGVQEYVFELAEEDVLIWGGASTSDGAKFVVFDPAGEIVAYMPSSFTQLAAGRYILRASVSSGNSPVQFRCDLGSKLSYFDGERIEATRKGWENETLLFRSGFDRIYFRHDLDELQSTLEVYSSFTDQTESSSNYWQDDQVVHTAGEAVYVRIAAQNPLEPYSYDYRVFATTDAAHDYRLGNWIDSSGDSPGQKREFSFPVDVGHFYVLDRDTSVGVGHYKDFELEYPGRDTFESLRALHKVSFPGTATIKGDKQYPDSAYRFRVRDVTNGESLSMGTHRVPALFESDVYVHEVAELEYLRFDSEHSIVIYKDTDFGLEELDQTEFDYELDTGTYYISVRRIAGVATDTWAVKRALIPNPGRAVVEPLPGNRNDVSTEVLRENFYPGRTHHFTFDAEANDLYVLGGIGRDASYTSGPYLTNASGSTVPSSSISGSRSVWRIESPGTYTLRMVPSTDKIHFQWLRLHAAPALADDQSATGALTGRRADVYRISDATTEMVAISDSWANGLNWGFLDEDGEEVLPVTHLSKDVSTEFASRNVRWLLVLSSNHSVESPYQIRWRAPNVETEFVLSPYDHLFKGELTRRSDKKIFEFEMGASDTVEFESFSFAPEDVEIAFDRVYVGSAESMRQPIYRTRKYELQISSKKDQPIDFRFRLRKADSAPDHLVDGEFVGFDSVQTGSVPLEGFEYRFSIPEGGFYAFDWRAAETEAVVWSLTSPSGELVADRLPPVNSRVFRATEHGEYTLTLHNRGDGLDSPFRFAMLSPNTAVPVELNEFHDGAPLPPRSTRFYRLRLDQPTEFEVDATFDTQTEIAIVTVAELSESSSFQVTYPPRIGKSKEGDLVLRQVNPTDGELDFDFSVRDLRLSPQVELDSEFSYTAQSGELSTFLLHVPEPMALSFESSDLRATGGVIRKDFQQTSRIDIDSPGDYYFRFGTYGDIPNSTSFTGSLNRRKVNSFQLDLEKVTAGEIERFNDWHEYYYHVDAGARLWFAEFERSTHATWVSPTGIEYRAEGALPTYETGTYRLRFADEDYRFKVSNMEAVDVINSGLTRGEFPIDDPGKLLRIQGISGQYFRGSWTIGNGFVGGSFHDVAGNELRRVDSWYVIPDDGAYLSFVRQSRNEASQYAANIELFEDLPLVYTIGDQLEFPVPKHHFRTLSFALSQGDYYRVDVAGAIHRIESNPQVSSRQFNRPEGPVFDSTYQLWIWSEQGTSEAKVRIASLNEAIGIEPGRKIRIEPGRYYRLDVGETGSFAVDVLDPTGVRKSFLPEIELPSGGIRDYAVKSESNPGDRPRYTLAAGKYWFRIPDLDNAPSDWTAEVVTLRLNERSITTDEVVQMEFDEDGKDEYLISVDMRPFSRVLPDFSFSEGVKLQYRNEDDIYEPWRDITEFRVPYMPSIHETFLVRATGIGTATFTLVNLNEAPELPSNTTVRRSLPSNSRMVAYRITGDIGQRIQVQPSAKVPGVTLQLLGSDTIFVDSMYDAPVQISRTNNQPLTLVILFDDLVEGIDIAFDTIANKYA